MTRGPIIAIDGPAGAGKSTVARHLAHHFGLLNLETGAMYRAFALKAIESDQDFDDARSLERLARDTEIRLESDRSNESRLSRWTGRDRAHPRLRCDPGRFARERAPRHTHVDGPAAAGTRAPGRSGDGGARHRHRCFSRCRREGLSRRLARSAQPAALRAALRQRRDGRRQPSSRWSFANCASATSATAAAPTRRSTPPRTPWSSTRRLSRSPRSSSESKAWFGRSSRSAAPWKRSARLL